MKFPGFQLSEKIHQGPSCQVWKGFNFQHEYPVALKIFQPAHVPESELPYWEELFSNEADILCRLNHSGIIRFFQTIHAYTGESAIVMEWSDGRPMTALTKLTEEQAGAVAVKVLAALAYLQKPFNIGDRHFTTVSHGDIKPSNILIAEDGVRLLDFGFSCPPDLDVQGVLGTPYYCRPGRMNGVPPSWRDDAYALALTLVEACGQEPETPKDLANLGPIFKVFSDLQSSTPPSPVNAIRRIEEILGRESYGPIITALSKSPMRDIQEQKTTTLEAVS
jgi:serine/threonine protein kinase